MSAINMMLLLLSARVVGVSIQLVKDLVSCLTFREGKSQHDPFTMMLRMTYRFLLLASFTVASFLMSPLAMAFVNRPTIQRPASVARNLYIDPDMTGTIIGPGKAAVSAAVASSNPSTSRRRQPPSKDYLYQVSNPDEFEQAVKNESEKLVVVRFHAPYCKACKSIQVAYERLAHNLSGRGVKFVDVSIQDRDEFPDLNVPATPYAQIYHPELGLVEDAPIARRHLSTFRKVLKWYVDGMADLEEEFFSSPSTYEPPRMVGLTTS